MGAPAIARKPTRGKKMAHQTVLGFDGPQATTLQLLWIMKKSEGLKRFTIEDLEKAMTPLVPMLEGFGLRTLAVLTISNLVKGGFAQRSGDGKLVCFKDKFTQIKSEVIDRLVTARKQKQIRNLYVPHH